MSEFNNTVLLHMMGRLQPFEQISSILWRANQILSKRSTDQLDKAAIWLKKGISEIISQNIEEEIYDRASALHAQGGWELSYLPHDCEPTEQEIRDLLENWPSDADDPLSLNGENGFSDLAIVHELLPDCTSAISIEDWLDISHAELYAVLALIHVEYAASCFSEDTANLPSENWQEKSYKLDYPTHLANHVIDAMEIICWAERELPDAALLARRNEEKNDIAKAAAAVAVKNNASHAAKVKYAVNNAARYFVQKKWEEERTQYKNNKSDFARTYVKIVAQEFLDSNQDPLRITERTLKEDWLSDTGMLAYRTVCEHTGDAPQL